LWGKGRNSISFKGRAETHAALARKGKIYFLYLLFYKRGKILREGKEPNSSSPMFRPGRSASRGLTLYILIFKGGFIPGREGEPQVVLALLRWGEPALALYQKESALFFYNRKVSYLDCRKDCSAENLYLQFPGGLLPKNRQRLAVKRYLHLGKRKKDPPDVMRRFTILGRRELLESITAEESRPWGGRTRLFFFREKRGEATSEKERGGEGTVFGITPKTRGS